MKNCGINAFGILLAAGSSQRMGRCKLTIPLDGKNTAVSLCVHEMIHAGIKNIAITVSDDTKECVERVAAEFGKQADITIVAGGKTRGESVKNALFAANGAYSLAVIHDCARCMATSEIFVSCMNMASEYGCAIAATRVVDTVRNKNTGAAYNRDELLSIQTPQVFDFDAISQAYASRSEYSATDDCEVFMQAGGKPCFCVTDEPNMKLTYPADIQLFSALLSMRNK